MGSGSLQIDPNPFKKVELALFCLYLKELVGKMQENPSICTLFSKVGGPGTPAQNHRFHTNSKITKIEDLTWCSIASLTSAVT